MVTAVGCSSELGVESDGGDGVGGDDSNAETGEESDGGDGEDGGGEDGGGEEGEEDGAEAGGEDGGDVDDELDDDFLSCTWFQEPDCDGVECGENESAQQALEVLLAAPMFAGATRDIWVTRATDGPKFVDHLPEERVFYVEYVADAGWAAGRGQLYYEYEGSLDLDDLEQWAGDIEPFTGIDLAPREDVEASYAGCYADEGGLELNPCADGILLEGEGEGPGIPWELVFIHEFAFGDDCVDFGQLRVDGSTGEALSCYWDTECE